MLGSLGFALLAAIVVSVALIARRLILYKKCEVCSAKVRRGQLCERCTKQGVHFAQAVKEAAGSRARPD